MKKCILIFDDDYEILLVCKVILEQQNYHVETRERCENIIQDLMELKPDIVLIDLWIPQIGGENAVSLIKNNEDTKHIPVLLFSANDEIDKIFKRTNANGYLKKPFEISALVQIIKANILEKKLKEGQ